MYGFILDFEFCLTDARHQQHSFNYCHFVVSFEIGKCEFSNFALHYKIILTFGISDNSIWILGSVVLFLLKRQLGF